MIKVENARQGSQGRYDITNPTDQAQPSPGKPEAKRREQEDPTPNQNTTTYHETIPKSYQAVGKG